MSLGTRKCYYYPYKPEVLQCPYETGSTTIICMNQEVLQCPYETGSATITPMNQRVANIFMNQEVL